MTPNTLQRLKELHAASTQGSWEASVKDITCYWEDKEEGYRKLGHYGNKMDIYDEGGHTEADAEFIAEAHNSLPQLIASLEKAMKCLDTIERLHTTDPEFMKAAIEHMHYDAIATKEEINSLLDS